jgi:hypothetical protein
MRIHHNTVRILDKGSVCVRGLPAEGAGSTTTGSPNPGPTTTEQPPSQREGNFFEKDNRSDPRPDKPAGHAPTLSFAGRKAFRKSAWRR